METLDLIEKQLKDIVDSIDKDSSVVRNQIKAHESLLESHRDQLSSCSKRLRECHANIVLCCDEIVLKQAEIKAVEAPPVDVPFSS